MDFQAEIKWIQAELLKVRDPELINAFKSLLKYREKKEMISADWWDEVSEEEKEELKQSEEEINKGDYLSHEEVMSNPRKWL